MGKEVEKKFRLSTVNFSTEKGKKIKQAYLDFTREELKERINGAFDQEIDFEAIKEARVRQKGEGEKAKYFLTLKSDGTLERDEYETEISAEQFEEYWAEASEGKVDKTRYEIEFEKGLVGEADIYEGNLKGLLTAEFEYDPEVVSQKEILELAQTLDPETEDVTEIKAYKNRNLAKMESLRDLEEAIKKELDAKMMKELNGEPTHNPVQ